MLSYISEPNLTNFSSEIPVIRNGRTILTTIQTKILKEQYERNKFPNRWEKNAIANQTGLHTVVVSNWFQNRRNRNKTVASQQYMTSDQKYYV